MKTYSRISLIFVALILVFTLFFGVTGVAQAADFDNDGTIGPNEVIDDDLFLNGNTVAMAGTINGNLVAAGNTVTVSGTVNGDAFIFGNTLLVEEGAVITGNLFFGGQTANVAGSVRNSVFGGSTSVTFGPSSVVSGNVYYGGFQIETLPGASVGRDLYTGVYQATLNGNINGSLKMGGSSLVLGGPIGGDATIDVSGSTSGYTPSFPGIPGVTSIQASGITMTEGATIGGTLTYTADQPTVGQNAAPTVVYQTPVPYGEDGYRVPSTPMARFRISWVGGVLAEFIKLMALGALALWLIPVIMRKTSDALGDKPWYALGYGFLIDLISVVAAIMLPLLFIGIGIMVALISLGGLTNIWCGSIATAFCLVLMAFAFLVFTGSVLVVCYTVGDLLLTKVAPAVNGKKWLAMLCGVAIFVLVTRIPVIGWLIGLASGFLGIGAMWLAWRKTVKPAGITTP